MSLVEALVALAIIGVALLLTLPLLTLELRLQNRLQARAEAREVVEEVVERVRIATVPDPRVALEVAASREPGRAQDLAVAARLLPESGPPGLLRLEVVATWSVRGRQERLEIATLLWREAG